MTRGRPSHFGKASALLLAVGLVLSNTPLVAAVLPLEFRQAHLTYNLQSQRGAPITGPGSDGRQPPASENQSGSNLSASPGQFSSAMTFGGVTAPLDRAALASSSLLQSGNTPFSPAVMAQMQLPSARSNNVTVMALRRAQVGASYLSRQISFLFGSVIPVPDTDEHGALLTNIVKEVYWLPEPYSPAGHGTDHYYWSPHSRKVYAIQAGPINVTWRTAASTTTQPPDYAANPANYHVEAGHYFRLFTATYIVSGSAVKTPRKMYWTEKEFQRLGRIVTVPAARVGAVAIVYNNNFPRTVAAEYESGQQTSITDGTTNSVLPELRTLWFDQQQGTIHAYNQEGRVFVELLGDSRSDGQSRMSLGFEIVDVFKQVNPSDVTVELGERVVPPPPGVLANLFPQPLAQSDGQSFAFQHNVGSSGGVAFYAIRETRNLNDFMVHWMEAGEVGLKWPSLFARYRFVWPDAAAKYSHYMRPLVSTEAEAQSTAVPLPTINVPIIEHQDALDIPRAKLTGDFKFYTFLTQDYPAHRTLLRFTANDRIAFERVFSWLDSALVGGAGLDRSVATTLVEWNPTTGTLAFADPLVSPRVVNETVEVGQRITAPAGELGSSGDEYNAGYIWQLAGNLYNPSAYIDPFATNAAPAKSGAIIPVNAIPGANQLDVWWFRNNQADTAHGFSKVSWPSAIGRYTIQWPANPPEIVLASNLGSAGGGVADPFVARGSIYSQNHRGLPGYNPNEEHAIMSGGAAFALRDDLNITSGANYSSMPFVLVDYTTADGRPAMAVFKVVREKPESGWVFDYVVKAGSLLQPPMPLGLLAPPVQGSGASAINFNTESLALGDLPGSWAASRDSAGSYSHYTRFTYRDRKEGFWVYRGLHAGLPGLRAGSYVPATDSFAALPGATAVVGQPFSYFVHASRQAEPLSILSTSLPGWLRVQGLSLRGTPQQRDTGSITVPVIVADRYDGSRVTNTLTINVTANGTASTQGPLALSSTNSYTGIVVTYTNRPPFLAHSPVPTNSFTMKFYYKTQEGFDWPAITSPPSAGSIVPYLRPLDASGNSYQGDPASSATASLEIVYRPVWPVTDSIDGSKPVPVLRYGQTLTEAINGLPGVRNFQTAEILYQQSIAANMTLANFSATMVDPTRQKVAGLSGHQLNAIPGGVQTDLYQGRYYFPALPPHLSSRLFFDPNVGAKGSLIFNGEFKDEIVGEKYVLLNVLRDEDLAAVKALCPPNDPDYAKWSSLIDGMTATVETFHEDPARPGTYVANTNLTTSVRIGEVIEIKNSNMAVDSYALSGTGPGSGYVTLVEGGGRAFTQPGDPVALHVFKVGGGLYTGELKVIAAPNPLSEKVTLQHTGDMAGRASDYRYEWMIGAPAGGVPPLLKGGYNALTKGDGVVRYTLGGAGIQALSDNYIVMRYQPVRTDHPFYNTNVWSEWTQPQLAEGWIKRVLAGINPFNQRTSDLFNNRVNTDASIIEQAGHRWEGDVALNASTLNNFGLIEIYETVLRRGRALSIEAGFNYGPANDALLLAAGYINDLYIMLGAEAWADALNPTIGIGTQHETYGDIATALFAFKGQLPSVADEELALMRGRDDFLQPTVQTPPFYNRLIWNYTRGIDSGEVIYALNYDISDQNNDGVIDATDAARLYPQAHGDAYGHYLTALKGYYLLLMNPNFDWVPRTEAVTILNSVVSVDYLDERKFAAAAAAVARAGQQVFDLTWRQDYQSTHAAGWNHLGEGKVNASRPVIGTDGSTNNTVRYWGLDHWATRTGQGAYLNWVIGNAIVPATDPDPSHEGIQRVDRSTVPELLELPASAESLQVAMDNAENSLTPLGLSQGSVAFDINPNHVLGTDNGSHFEQVYQRALVALRNATVAFDDAKDVTHLMRSEQDSLSDFRIGVENQELAYTHSLIELYGSPYPDDIGPGQFYPQGYTGPDLIHFAYVDAPQLTFPGLIDPNQPVEVLIDIQNYSVDYESKRYGEKNRFDFVASALKNNPSYTNNSQNFIRFTLDAFGNFKKPGNWTGQRASPGRIQEAISGVLHARNAASQALSDSQGLKRKLDRNKEFFQAKLDFDDVEHGADHLSAVMRTVADSAAFAGKIGKLIYDQTDYAIESLVNAGVEAIPKSTIVGLADGGDILSGARAAVLAEAAIAQAAGGVLSIAKEIVVGALQVSTDGYLRQHEADVLGPGRRNLANLRMVVELDRLLSDLQSSLFTINRRLEELEGAVRKYRALVAEGDRLQEERNVFRQRAAAVVQGYRTRDAALRLFRNEKLERYKTLFELSSRYAFLAANAYDYETGLLGSQEGQAFIKRILGSRALGVIRDGEPQFAGSDSGDPGLSSALAEMKADWDVLKGRLGVNNPDAYGTTASLRTEHFRILPGTNGVSKWQDILRASRKADLLDDEDVRRYCMQIAPGDGVAAPGFIIEFSTTIIPGLNLFGQPIAPGDHAYSPSSYATKLFAAGVAFEGYRGMDNPAANSSGVGSANAVSPSDPGSWYLDPLALGANPYVYLIPVGVDVMRTPPVGGTSAVRTWNVNDVAVPLPFNIGAVDSSRQFMSSDFLAEPFFEIRRHQAFRPVSSDSFFNAGLYGPAGTLQRSQYTNNRLVSRSVWNTKWKLVIPGYTLLNNSKEGMDRFVKTVTDIKVHFVTYSFSGN